MKRIAVIVAGRVENVVAHLDSYTPATGEVDVTNLPVGPGHLYDGEFFTSPPLPPFTETTLDFKRRFTAAERIGIRASTDPVVVDFMDLLDTASEVKFSDPDLIAGTTYLEETAALLDDGRAVEILTP